MNNPDSALRRAFSAQALRDLQKAPPTTAEWDMVVQNRINALLQSYDNILRDKDVHIAALEKEVAQLKYSQLANAQGPVFLVDGSGSMASLQTALPAVLAAASKKADARVVMWGSSQPAVIDLKNKDIVRAAQAGLNSGSDLAPALRLMSQIGGKQHLILVSDGDIFDEHQCKPFVEALLSTGDVALDVIIINDKPSQTRMELFLRSVSIGEKARAPYIVTSTSALADIDKAIARLTRKKCVPKKQPQP